MELRSGSRKGIPVTIHRAAAGPFGAFHLRWGFRWAMCALRHASIPNFLSEACSPHSRDGARALHAGHDDRWTAHPFERHFRRLHESQSRMWRTLSGAAVSSGSIGFPDCVNTFLTIGKCDAEKFYAPSTKSCRRSSASRPTSNLQFAHHAALRLKSR